MPELPESEALSESSDLEATETNDGSPPAELGEVCYHPDLNESDSWVCEPLDPGLDHFLESAGIDPATLENAEFSAGQALDENGFPLEEL
jgi:hypothetical protein